MKYNNEVINYYETELRAGREPKTTEHTLTNYMWIIMQSIEDCYKCISDVTYPFNVAQELLFESTEDLLAILMKANYSKNIDFFIAAVNELYNNIFNYLEKCWNKEKDFSTMNYNECKYYAAQAIKQFMKDLKLWI